MRWILGPNMDAVVVCRVYDPQGRTAGRAVIWLLPDSKHEFLEVGPLSGRRRVRLGAEELDYCPLVCAFEIDGQRD